MKKNEYRRPVAQYQAYQYMHNGHPRRRVEREREEIMAKNFTDLKKDMNLNIQEAQ